MIPLLDFNQMNIIHRFGFQNEKNYSDKEKKLQADSAQTLQKKSPKKFRKEFNGD